MSNLTTFHTIPTTIMKSLEYPLAALSLTQAECNKLVRPIFNAALPQSKICRNFPHALIYGTKDVLGFNFNDLYIPQGAAKVKILLKHLYTDDLTGPLLRANLEWAQIEVGVGRNIFDLDYDTYGHLLPPTWIKSLWEFASLYNIKLPNVNNQLDLHWENDVFLIEQFAEAHYSPNDLLKLN